MEIRRSGRWIDFGKHPDQGILFYLFIGGGLFMDYDDDFNNGYESDPVGSS